jgi:sialate O-acetylesterase
MNFLGLLRMYQVSGDSSYLRKVVGAWNDIASRQRYITGGVSVGEHYERDHILPLTGEMMETCATMSWMQLSQALLDITGDPKYADAIERIQWNNVFAEQTIDGDANHYFTPPNGYTPKGYFREPDCCMSSGPRLLSMLPGFIYAEGPHQAIVVNQFVTSTTTIGKTHISQQTNFPEDGNSVITIDPVRPAAFTVKVRIPAWVEDPTLTLNGKAVNDVRPGAYAIITRTWRPGDKLTLELPMQLQWVRHAHYQKTADRKPYKTQPDPDAPYALVRGPVVYAVDDIWYKGDTATFFKGWMDSMRIVLDNPATLRQLPSPDKHILGPGYEVELLDNGRKIPIPVYPFANIGKWYRDPSHKPDSNSAAWSYAIWLKAAHGYPEHVAGALTLPYIFGNNMVLQRDAPLPIWGSADPGTPVTAVFKEQTKTVNADDKGHWRVTFDPLPASDQAASLLVFSGHDTLQENNILVGDVWFCSGQSNMEYSMRKNSKFEKAAHGSGPHDALDSAHNTDIRLFLVRPNYSKPDNVHIRREWDAATGAALRDFSAAGYFFAAAIYAREHVPIGLISNAVPGSRIEPFLPGDGADSTGKFYQTIVKPLAPYALKGFLWYQGESNCFLNDTLQYAEKMKTLIEGWRTLWGNSSLPFYYVQIAPYYYSRSNGGNQSHSPSAEAAFWEAQEKALKLPHTGMVVTTDLVDNIQDLHPAYKWEVGRRLALLALANDYHQPVICSGPVFKSVTVKGRSIIVTFTNTGSGLVSHDGKPLDWFETAGRDGNFVAATATIEGKDTLIVKAKKKPVAIRFGWNEAAQPNLYNKEGLPAMPFRAAINDSK